MYVHLEKFISIQLKKRRYEKKSTIHGLSTKTMMMVHNASLFPKKIYIDSKIKFIVARWCSRVQIPVL